MQEESAQEWGCTGRPWWASQSIFLPGRRRGSSPCPPIPSPTGSLLTASPVPSPAAASPPPHIFLPSGGGPLYIQVRGSPGQGSFPHHLSIKNLRARAMFMRCPTRVTPRSMKSSLVRDGRWEPSISLSRNRSRCSPSFRYSSQSATSYLVQKGSGLEPNGLSVAGGRKWVGDRERLPEGKPGKGCSPPEVGEPRRSKTPVYMGTEGRMGREDGRGAGLILCSLGRAAGLGARRRAGRMSKSTLLGCLPWGDLGQLWKRLLTGLEEISDGDVSSGSLWGKR